MSRPPIPARKLVRDRAFGPGIQCGAHFGRRSHPAKDIGSVHDAPVREIRAKFGMGCSIARITRARRSFAAGRCRKCFFPGTTSRFANGGNGGRSKKP